ncbi:helix-turn-helix domain-containing protein [Bacillus cereus]
MVFNFRVALETHNRFRTPKTDLILELLDQGKTKQEIADFLNVDRTTIYRTLKRNGY